MRVNAAARQWLQACGVDENQVPPALEHLVAVDGPSQIVLGDLSVPCVVVPLDDGALVWLQTASPAGAPGAAPGTTDAGLRAAGFLERALELAGVSVWRIDLAARRIHFNAVGLQIMGLDPEPDGVDLEALRASIHPDDRESVLRAAEEALAGDHVVDLIARWPGRHGPWRTLLTRRVAERDRDGKVLGLAGISLDITERERAEVRARHERRRTEMAIEAAGLGVWERDLAGRVMYWNEGMYRMRGLRSDDPRTAEQIMLEITHPEDLQAQVVRRQQHLQEGLPYRHEFRVRLPDGSWRWLAAEGQAVRDAKGTAIGLAGVNIDVTERKTSERLRQQARRLAQSSLEKSAFMARMSHELRTPMNAVLGFTRLLQNDTEQVPSKRQAERLEHIAQAGGQLMKMIDDLLQISQREADAAAPAQGTSLDVLCVEDNPVNLQLVRELLALRPAMRLRTAETGGEGITRATDQPPDLVLLDLQLPDMPGTEVMHRLRAEPRLARCRIVALSADAMPDHIQAALAAGFDDYWTKPIEFDRFLSGLDHMAQARAAARGDINT